MSNLPGGNSRKASELYDQDSDHCIVQEEKEKVVIPNQIRQVFVDFTIAYLMEPIRPNPTEIDSFALRFFRDKARQTNAMNMTAEELELIEEEDGFVAFPSITNLQTKNYLNLDPKMKYVLDPEIEDWISKFTVAFLTEMPPPSSIIIFGIQYCQGHHARARGRDIVKHL